MSSIEFKQEYEAEFLDDRFSPFTQQLLEFATVDIEFESIGKPGGAYYIGVDLGRKQDASVIIVVELLEDGTAIIRSIKEIRNDGSLTYWTRVIDEVEFTARAFMARKICIDQSGVGDAPTLDLQNRVLKSDLPTEVKGITFSYGTKNSFEGVVSSLIIAFERGRLKIPMNERLIRQLKNIRAEVSDAGNRRFISIGRSPDYVMALSLAVYGMPRFGGWETNVKSKTIEKKEDFISFRNTGKSELIKQILI